MGWRLWRARGGSLDSWAVTSSWTPGENTAECLSQRACEGPPGRHCQCGFWGLWTAQRCLERVHIDTSGLLVMGLVSAWGTVALHGEEGFRAQYAAVRCLFSDRLTSGGESRLTAWIMAKLRRPLPTMDENWRMDTLNRVAAAYGVPLVSMQDAERLGVLSEMGAALSGARRAQDSARSSLHWMRLGLGG